MNIREIPSQFTQPWIGAFADWQQYGLQPSEALVSLPPEKMRTHTLVIGATGSGKTTLLHHLIAQDITLGHSFVVLDLRGDLVTASLEMCAGRVQPESVRVLDLRERIQPLGFDPLSGNGEPYFRALHVLEVLAQESESWGVQLAETLRNGLMLLAEAERPLTELEQLLIDADYRHLCLNRNRTDSVAAFWQRFDALSPEKQAALVMPVLNKVSLLLATGPLRATLGHERPLDLARHLNTPGSIFLVSLAAEELYAAGRMMGSLVLSSVCREIFARVGQAEHHRNPVRLYVDEFEHFGSRDFEALLAEGRRFGLSLVLAHQTLAQLNPKLRSLILNNVGTKFVFRCGRDDGSTLSRDLTGDPRMIDFAGLPVGRAAMWQADTGATEIEINAPIFRSVGRLSRDGAAFLDEVYRRSHPLHVRLRPALPARSAATPVLPPRLVTTDRRARGPSSRRVASTRVAKPTPVPLEDWLWS